MAQGMAVNTDETRFTQNLGNWFSELDETKLEFCLLVKAVNENNFFRFVGPLLFGGSRAIISLKFCL